MSVLLFCFLPSPISHILFTNLGYELASVRATPEFVPVFFLFQLDNFKARFQNIGFVAGLAVLRPDKIP